MKRKRILLSLLILVLTLSGCNLHTPSRSSSGSSSESGKPGASSSAPASDSSSQTGSNKGIPYTQVFHQPKVLTFNAKLESGIPWFPLTITDDGQIFGFTAAVQGRLSKIIDCDLKTQKSTVLYTLPDNYEPEFFQCNENYLLWTEYLPPSVSGQIKVVLFNRKTKTAKTLHVRNFDSNTADDQIALGDTFALFSTADSDKNKKISYNIYKYDFETGKTSLFQKNGDMPVVGSGFAAWIGPNKGNSAVFVQDLKTGAVKTVSSGLEPSYIAACGSNLVYSGPIISKDPEANAKGLSGNELVLYKDGKQRIIEQTLDHDYEFPSASNKFVAWDENVEKRVFCIDSGVITDFLSEYATAYVCNNYIMWGEDAIKNESKDQAVKDGMYQTKLNIINVSDYS